MLAALATVAVLASSAYAQFSANISSGCQSTLAGIAGSSDGACLNAAGLVASVATTNGDTSLISPLNQWLTGMCSQDACSNATLSNIISNVTSGCSSDLSSLGFTSSDTQEVIQYAQQFYPTAREVLCLKNSTSNSLCVTDIANSLQSELGTLSENNLVNIAGKLISGGFNATALTKNLICSDCAKAAVGVLDKNIPGLLDGDAKSSLSSQCGSGFTDGTTPSSVSQTAKGLSTTKSGALATFPATALVGGLSLLASAFVVLA